MRNSLPAILGLIGLAGLSSVASAQTETLIRGNVDDGFVVAPDFKFTDVGGDFASLAGGYGGWVINRKLLLGGGLYTLANGSDAVGMTYGGGVVEYFVNSNSLVNVSVRGLVGGGSATLETLRDGRRFPFGRIGDPLGFRFRPDRDRPVLELTESADFFVAEPELNVMLNVTERFRVSFGGGYRFIGGASRLNERLDGFTANAALKLSFF
jgi:hypothetical protein